MNPGSGASSALKENVSSFNQDVARNRGYVYTSDLRFSSRVANQRLTEAIAEAIENVLPSQGAPIQRVVDIGCGDGTYTHELHRRFPSLALTGLDPATGAIQRARGAYPELEFLDGNILDPATLPQRSFELAIFRGVLHHVSNPALAIQNAGKLADRILIVEPNGYNPILKLIERVSSYHREHQEQSFRLGKLKSWCQAAGYRVCSVGYVGFVPFFFPTLPAKLIYALQPGLEKIPGLKQGLTACYVILGERARDRK